MVSEDAAINLVPGLIAFAWKVLEAFHFCSLRKTCDDVVILACIFHMSSVSPKYFEKEDKTLFVVFALATTSRSTCSNRGEVGAYL